LHLDSILKYIYVVHESALHAAKLRVELSQSRTEQKDYLKNVELARILEKRAERKRQAGKTDEDIATTTSPTATFKRSSEDRHARERPVKKSRRAPQAEATQDDGQLDNVLHSIF
jgi:ESF2/ABP1 family protein